MGKGGGGGGGGKWREEALKVGSRENTSSRSRCVFFQPPSSTGHTGNLPRANKTSKPRKMTYIVLKAKINNLTWWFCLKIAVFCHLLN